MLSTIASFAKPLLFPCPLVTAEFTQVSFCDSASDTPLGMGRCEVQAHTVPQLCANILAVLAGRVYLSTKLQRFSPGDIKRIFQRFAGQTLSKDSVVKTTQLDLHDCIGWVQLPTKDVENVLLSPEQLELSPEQQMEHRECVDVSIQERKLQSMQITASSDCCLVSI
jgi:hypothetical protein